jgi:type III pantothenate kinase
MNRLLAIDIGNTRTKWGVHGGHNWLEQGFLETAQLLKFAARIKHDKISNKINKIYISSVADESLTSTLIQQLPFTATDVQLVRARSQQCGVINHYDTPEQLGSDRWCALIGARQLYNGSAIVVMAGTAMTVDALTAEGHFLGGIILPGLVLMQDALRSRTARLQPEVATFLAFPTHTQDAIHSGIISASLGAIEKMRSAMHAAGHPNASCIISGGSALWLAPHLAQPVLQTDNLVLEGLLQMAKSESTEHT